MTYEIAEMTPPETSRFKNKFPSLKPYQPLFKVWIQDHGWHRHTARAGQTGSEAMEEFKEQLMKLK